MKEFDTILVCPECGKIAKKRRRWSLGRDSNRADNEWIYVCSDYPSCDTYVGCHPGTDVPLGFMAGRELRLLRRKAHKALDWAWQFGGMSRTAAYRKLAEVLGISSKYFEKDAHIARLDEDQCRVVIASFNKMRPWKMPHSH